jgi:hypothetical protein
MGAKTQKYWPPFCNCCTGELGEYTWSKIMGLQKRIWLGETLNWS